MILRFAKSSLLIWCALYFAIVVFNNITDYNSNYEFVRHVMAMDTTFPGNRLMWRALTEPAAHHFFYVCIILWEAAITAICSLAAFKMLASVRVGGLPYQAARNWAVAGLTLALALWFGAFMTVAGEWFAMWQSQVWNGLGSAHRMFTVMGIILVVVLLPENEP